MFTRVVVFGFALSVLPSLAQASDKIKIGFITTLSGPNAELGQEMNNAFKLAIQNLGDKVGGMSTEIYTADDESRSDVGRKAADKMVEDYHVDIITGIVYSNVAEAIAKPVLDSGTLFVSGNGNTTQLSGNGCRPNFFSLAPQTDTVGTSVALMANTRGYKRVYVMAGNYAGGRSPADGFKREFKGTLAGETYPPLGQFDFAVEIAAMKGTNPDALYSGYTGGMSLAFIKQFAQAGLMKALPLISVWGGFEPFSQLEALGDAAVGARGTVYYHSDLDNAANKKFVADFVKTYHSKPGTVASNEYDAVNVIDAAVRAIKGRIEDRAAFAHAIKTVKFDSVRGPTFRFNNNNYPIVSYYAVEVVKRTNGQVATELGGVVAPDMQDFYAKDCAMH